MEWKISTTNQEVTSGEIVVCYVVNTPPPARIIDDGISEHFIGLHRANPGNLARVLERRLDGERLLSSPTFPGVMTFVPAGRQTEWWWESEVEVLEVLFPPRLLEQVARAGGDRIPDQIELLDRFAIQDPLLEQLILTLGSLIGSRVSDRLYQDTLQNMLAIHLLRHHCTTKILNSPISGGLSPSDLRQLIDYIHTHLSQNMGLEELAQLVNLSSHHFGKLFKESMGITIHQYVLQCRVDRAKKLLTNQKLSLAAIAQTVGFYDQSHFTNVFRRQTKLTPRQYRAMS
jgi:AraC family transcriptional regulator